MFVYCKARPSLVVAPSGVPWRFRCLSLGNSQMLCDATVHSTGLTAHLGHVKCTEYCSHFLSFPSSVEFPIHPSPLFSVLVPVAWTGVFLFSFCFWRGLRRGPLTLVVCCWLVLSRASRASQRQPLSNGGNGEWGCRRCHVFELRIWVLQKKKNLGLNAIEGAWPGLERCCCSGCDGKPQEAAISVQPQLTNRGTCP